MIVPMRRVDLLCLEQDRDRTLCALRALGVLHVHVRREPDRPGATPDDARIEHAAAGLREVERVLEALPARPGSAASGRSADDAVARAAELLDERRGLEASLAELREREREMAPFGRFSPGDARALECRGVAVRLYRAGPGVGVEPPPGAVLRCLGRERGGTQAFAVIGPHAAAPGWIEMPLPDPSLDDVRAELRAGAARLEAITADLARMAGDRTAIERRAAEAREAVEFLTVRNAMVQTGPVLRLRGYCPAESIDRVREAAGRVGWGLRIAEPGPDDDTPTLVRNPAWVRPFEVVLDSLGLVPGYREVDMAPTLLFFFSLFFAMIVGDAGYGLVYLALTSILRRFLPQAPAAPFRLLRVLGVCTVVWGALSGSYFGIRAPWRLGWMDAEENMLAFCFALGAAHLTLAHLWNAVRFAPSPQALAQLGWIASTWTMYLAAMTFILDKPFPRWVLWPFGVGLALIALFMTPVRRLRAEWHQHVVFPLAVVSNFADVVSYVRLFAVGMAGYEVASNFNAAASALAREGWVGGLIAALILFIAHAVNIALSALSVVVHGVRLNALEFSSHLGVQWSGVRYTPFAPSTPDKGTDNFRVAGARGT